MAVNSYQEARREMRKLADPARAKLLRRFFKTGRGEYAEGDLFLGISVPGIRRLAAKYRDIPLSGARELLRSRIHEERLLALLILIFKFDSGTETERRSIFKLYLKHTPYINNWDLVDLSAYRIVGEYLRDKPRKALARLAVSKNLWERRIAVLSTFAYIKTGESADALAIAKILLNDDHDLIHKAVGWMLREVGKRCSQAKEEEFLGKHYPAMPRTMLRYAIERFPEGLRKSYLLKK